MNGSRAQLKLETGHQTGMESVPPHTSLKFLSKDTPAHLVLISPSRRHFGEARAGKKLGAGRSGNSLQLLG